MNRLPGRALACLCVLLGFCMGAAPPESTPWPQAGRTPQHTNFTPDSPAPPYKAVWRADFAPESIYSAQPVVADGRIILTTLNGNVYALDVASGQRLWHFKAGGVIWGGAALGTPELGGQGLSFLASWDGIVYGLDTASGKAVWQFDAGEPISASPCLARQMLYIGTRKGTMLAIGVDGKLKWRKPLSWHIFNTAAYGNGRVYLATMDMFIHCLDAASGNEIWTSPKLHGLSFREFYPVLHKGKVLVTVTPAVYVENTGPAPFGWGPPKELVAKAQEMVRQGQGQGQGKLPNELESGQQAFIDYYEKNPHQQSLYVLNQSDGKQAYFAVHKYGAAGIYNIAGPPAAFADGTIATYCLFSAARTARFDIDKNRWVDILFELGSTNTDESEFNTVGGNRLFSKNYMRHGHGQTVGQTMDMNTRVMTPLPSALPAPIAVSVLPRSFVPDPHSTLWRTGSSSWGPSGCSPPVISGKRLFWIKHISQLIAYEGN